MLGNAEFVVRLEIWQSKTLFRNSCKKDPISVCSDIWINRLFNFFPIWICFGTLFYYSVTNLSALRLKRSQMILSSWSCWVHWSNYISSSLGHRNRCRNSNGWYSPTFDTCENYLPVNDNHDSHVQVTNLFACIGLVLLLLGRPTMLALFL